MNRYLILVLLPIVIVGCDSGLPDEVAKASHNLPDVIDFNFHVKPILSDKCFACHGPDAQNQKADLRLDEPDGAYAALSSGAGHAVAPGNAGNSQLINRILATDKELIMPPAESNLVLSPEEKATLVKWINQGAEYKPHWAFTKPELPKLPDVIPDWAHNEIDRFIGEKLNQNGIEPAPTAAKEQLIRRLFFDITGLPPTIADMNRWMGKDNDSYYGQLVDSLLSLPAYGERMAAHWLDVARFADSEGYLDDFHHTFWPYRDWVIRAFNQNLPYDEFIVWQIGGDQIPNATTEQKLATAFNRNHKQNSEGGIIPEEFRVEYVADRTNTVGSAFMGLTMGCARCHDHKYDPISQENYFELFSFFNSNIERGDGIFSLNSIENGQMVPNKYSMNAGPVLPLFDEKTEEIREFLLAQIEGKKDSLELLKSSNQADFNQWLQTASHQVSLDRIVQSATVSHLTFDDMANGKTTDLTKGAQPAKYNGKIAPAPGKFGLAVRSDADGQLIAEGKKAIFERVDSFTISFWINAPKDFENAHVMYNGNNRIQGYRGWDIVLHKGNLHFRLNHAHPYQSLDIRTLSPLPVDEWQHFVWTYDGSGKAEGMSLYLNGKQVPTKIERNFLYRSTRPYLVPEATVYMPYRGLIIGKRHYDQDFTGGMLDNVQILNKEADPFVANYLFDKQQAIDSFNEALKNRSQDLKRFYDLFGDGELLQKREVLRELQAKEVTMVDTVQEIMVMEDFPDKRPTYILERGVYNAQGKPVSSDVPEAIFGMPDDLPRNRYGLGQWLTHPDHPLTARVAVNQIWYLVFGRGIVETVEDFGNQGALPSHPELLDWLSIDFQRNGWDLKRLVRQMVMSATYRQSSVIRPELESKDPNNILLARGTRYRRSAEMIRDNILASSGLLNNQVGGLSVFPYQPQGLWREVMAHGFFPEYEEDYEKGLYRRSIYTFWKRNMPPPSMLIFDASSRAECQVRRQRSNTPLQALVLLNDPQAIEGCRALAENSLKTAQGDLNIALEDAFRRLTSRKPTTREIHLLKAQYQEELAYFSANKEQASSFLGIGKKTLPKGLPATELAALARVANTILNTTEAYYKN
ncbi:MAG: DUF1553 domain-containing protein [Cyclobacteriaceae bacterium]